MSFAHLFITVILFLIYPTCKFGLYSWTKGQLEPFGFNKILGKCYYTDFIAILVYILYNVLLTCHLHIYNSNSVWIHPTCKFSLYSWTKAQLEYFASIKFSANAFIQPLLPFSYTSYITYCWHVICTFITVILFWYTYYMNSTVLHDLRHN